MKKILSLFFLALVITVFTGCGSNTSALSDKPASTEDKQNLTEEAGPESSALPDSKNAENVEPETTADLDYGKIASVDYHDYINGDEFDLDAYTSALGYEYVSDTSYNEDVKQEITTYGYIANNNGYHIYIGSGSKRLSWLNFSSKNEEVQIQNIDDYYFPDSATLYRIKTGGEVLPGFVEAEILEIDASIIKYLVSTEINDLFEFVKGIPGKRPASITIVPGKIVFKNNGFEDLEKTVLNETEKKSYIIKDDGTFEEETDVDEDDDDEDEEDEEDEYDEDDE